MASPVPPFPPPSRGGGNGTGSRLPLARRAGIAVFLLAAVVGGLGHVIGWRRTGTIALVLLAAVVLFLLVRGVRRRRASRLPGLRGMPPGLRGMPPGLRPARMPRGLGPGFRVPRGGMRIPGGALRGTRGGPLRIPRSVGRMRPPGLPGRPSRLPGAGLPPRGGSAARVPGGRRGGPFRPRAAGSPAFRPARGPRPGTGRARRPGTGSPGVRVTTGGALPRASRRSRPGTYGGGTPRPVRGWRRLVPPRLRPRRWGVPRASGPGGWPPAQPAPGMPSPRRRRRRGRRTAAPPRVRVRGGRRRLRMPWRRVRPRPVRAMRRRPFTRPWLLHHVRRFGRWRLRRKTARTAHRRIWRGMRASLISWIRMRRRSNGVPGPVPGPAPVRVRPPADPYAGRTPRAAANYRPAAPFAGGSPIPSSGGTQMPATAVSTPIQAAVEAIADNLGKYDPQKMVPDVHSYLGHLHEPIEALRDAIRNFAEKLGELPAESAVAEALKDMIPGLDSSVAAAQEVSTLFNTRHAEEIDRHFNPRRHEGAWNFEGAQ